MHSKNTTVLDTDFTPYTPRFKWFEVYIWAKQHRVWAVQSPLLQNIGNRSIARTFLSWLIYSIIFFMYSVKSNLPTNNKNVTMKTNWYFFKVIYTSALTGTEPPRTRTWNGSLKTRTNIIGLNPQGPWLGMSP